ncbi:hypothetical protein C5167_042354 [Papaver somniferum]|uniref:Uncharacterized protein n=1 Tax=Papaver somniferum TaxID=3469 RepID=A0A4Y7L574_PAPSO|nr:hypothetical protein C5167_042354 [Papaver somniferum]
MHQDINIQKRTVMNYNSKHSEHTFDGSGIKRILSNKFELEKTLDVALKYLPRNRSGELSKEYLRVAPDSLAPSASLPPYGAVNQVNNKPRLSIGKPHLRFNKSSYQLLVVFIPDSLMQN